MRHSSLFLGSPLTNPSLLGTFYIRPKSAWEEFFQCQHHALDVASLISGLFRLLTDQVPVLAPPMSSTATRCGGSRHKLESGSRRGVLKDFNLEG